MPIDILNYDPRVNSRAEVLPVQQEAATYLAKNFNMGDSDGAGALPYMLYSAFYGPALVRVGMRSQYMVTENLNLGMQGSVIGTPLSSKYSETLKAPNYNPNIRAEYERQEESTRYYAETLQERQEQLRKQEESGRPTRFGVDIESYKKRYDEAEAMRRKLKTLYDRRMRVLSPTHLEALNGMFSDRIEITREFQQEFYEDALEALPWYERAASTLDLVRLLRPEHQGEISMTTPPEHYLKAVAEAELRPYVVKPTARLAQEKSAPSVIESTKPKYTVVELEQKGGKDDDKEYTGKPVTYDLGDPNDENAYDAVMNRLMLQGEVFQELPQREKSEADEIATVITSCRAAARSITMQAVQHFVGYTGAQLYTEEEAISRQGRFEKVFPIGPRLPDVHVDFTDKGEIALFNKDGERMFMYTVITENPAEKDLFNVLLMEFSHKYDDEYTYHHELMKAQIVITKKIVSLLTEIADRLEEASPAKRKQAMLWAAQTANKYGRNLHKVYEPYLLPERIEEDGFEDTATELQYFELIRQGKEMYPGFRMNAGRGSDVGNEEIAELFPREANSELMMMSDDRTISRNRTQEYVRSAEKVPAMALEGFEALKDLSSYIETSVREIKPATSGLTIYSPPGEAVDYVIRTTGDITTTSAKYINIPHGAMGIPTYVRMIWEENNGEVNSYDFQQSGVKQKKDGGFYVEVPVAARNKKGVTFEVAMQSNGIEGLMPEELQVTDARAIAELRRVAGEILESDPRLADLAIRLEETITESGGQEAFNIHSVLFALRRSSYYPQEDMTAVLNLKKPIQDLGNFIDNETGLLGLQCETSNEVFGYLLGRILKHDSEVAVYVAKGYAVDRSRSQSGTVTISQAEAHAEVKLVKNGRVRYLNATPYITRDTQEYTVALPPNYYDVHASIEEEEDARQASPINRVDEIEARMGHFVAGKRKEIVAEREKLLNQLNETLGGLLTAERDMRNNLVEEQALYTASIQDQRLPLPRLILASKKFSEGQLSVSEYLIELDQIEQRVEHLLDRDVLKKMMRGRGIGMNNPQRYPSVYIAMRDLIYNSRKLLKF